tara:strand:+ start:562 stop:801 length:240 start_codon:yes stop_codon:yes gene_type:complete
MEVLNTVIAIVLLTAIALFIYVGLHISKEKKLGKDLPLFWEKEKDMGYGKGYPRKSVKKAKKPAMKKKKATKKKKTYRY